VKDERDELISRIMETQRDLVRLLAQNRPPRFDSNLTMRQLKVVMMLSASGSLSGQDLAAGLGVGLGTVTGIVDRLVAQGLVSRREDPHDRRVRRVELTPTGTALADQINYMGLEHMRGIVSRLDTEILTALDQVTRAILDVAVKLDSA
jgi:DNA-binding MarR family transcriptional regulator